MFSDTRFMPGVLFAEDFDDEPIDGATAPELLAEPDASPVASEDQPRYSEVELGDAVAIARAEGIALGRDEALRSEAARTADMVQIAASGLADTRAAVLEAVDAACERIASTALTVFVRFLPAVADRFAAEQLRATLHGFVGSLLADERVVVAVHPDLLDGLADVLPKDRQGAGMLEFRTDPDLARGDFAASWHHGEARRSTAALTRRMGDALAACGLLDPSLRSPDKENCPDGH